jgi:5-methylcytosine-specific restriction endonuclease McrA
MAAFPIWCDHRTAAIAARQVQKRISPKEIHKRWRSANTQKVAERTERWRRLNPDKRRIQNHRRRALERGASGSFTADDIRRLYAEQNGICAAPNCNAEMGDRYTIDHKIALARGGHNGPENIQLLCKRCNSAKHVKPLEQWLQEAAQ